MSEIDEWRNQIHQGDAAETLAEMPAGSVDCIMMSPPYFGLRNYNVDGQIGAEGSADAYVESIATVLDEARRVLVPRGSLWLNLGDSYGENKQKLLLPHQIALECQSRGWIVRNDNVWEKVPTLPEPVKDRLANKFEYVFHLVKQPQYYYELDRIREPHAESSVQRMSGPSIANLEGRDGNNDLEPEKLCHEKGKNPGDILRRPTASFPGEHTAAYSTELCELPIRATCPDDGIVLDPFVGSGTTCLAAKEFGRDFVGIDLNPEYVAMAQARVGVNVDQPELLDDDHTPLTAFTDGGEET